MPVIAFEIFSSHIYRSKLSSFRSAEAEIYILLDNFLTVLLLFVSSPAGTMVRDEPWPLLRMLVIGPDPVTFVSIF
jgi:hypothetical protein